MVCKNFLTYRVISTPVMSEKNNTPESAGSDDLKASNYKFKEMKVYSSDEWMADGTKKYRQVYSRHETTYMRIELSFYNKLFDEGDWEANVTLKCLFVTTNGQKELCNLTQKRKVQRDENIVYVRDAWGNPTPGAYWVKGNYLWQAYIDDVKIGEYRFYIEDVGAFNPGDNPFFDIESVKLFEGNSQATTVQPKTYLTAFNRNETRYVWGEFIIKNKVASDYYAELFFNFFDDAGQFKGRSTRLVYIQPNTVGQLYTVYPSWGSDTPGTWKDDAYTLEVVFMDALIATVPFRVGEQAAEGQVRVITDPSLVIDHTPGATNHHTNLDDLLFESLAELNALTGLKRVKDEVNEMVKLVRFYQESGKDILNRFSLHTVFTGNPGTGKTTVARILSKIYKGLGILEKGHLVEVDRQSLVAGYVGQTAIKTAEKINEAMGGVLFIDEAYALANERGSQHDFGAEAIQVILKRMEDFRGKFGVIVAGYTENMHHFITSNPGLRSRFDKYFHFDDYTPEEMYTIAMSLLAREDVKPNQQAADHLLNYFAFLFESRDRHFGNARTVRQVVSETVKNQHLRLASMAREDRTPALMETINFEDVKEFEIKNTPAASRPIGFGIGRSN